MVVTWQDRITKIIEINNRCNGLVRPFTSVKLAIQTMTLIIAKVPNLNNRVKDVMNLVKNHRFRCEIWLMCADAVR